jgi:hypothetical protein
MMSGRTPSPPPLSGCTSTIQSPGYFVGRRELPLIYVIGRLVTLSEWEADQLRAAAADAGRSIARRDLSLVLDRGQRTRTTLVLSRAEARELAELLTASGSGANLALLQQAFREALDDAPR